MTSFTSSLIDLDIEYKEKRIAEEKRIADLARNNFTWGCEKAVKKGKNSFNMKLLEERLVSRAFGLYQGDKVQKFKQYVKAVQDLRKEFSFTYGTWAQRVHICHFGKSLNSNPNCSKDVCGNRDCYEGSDEDSDNECEDCHNGTYLTRININFSTFDVSIIKSECFCASPFVKGEEAVICRLCLYSCHTECYTRMDDEKCPNCRHAHLRPFDGEIVQRLLKKQQEDEEDEAKSKETKSKETKSKEAIVKRCAFMHFVADMKEVVGKETKFKGGALMTELGKRWKVLVDTEGENTKYHKMEPVSIP